MAILTLVDIPEPFSDRFRRRAENAGTSIRQLIVRALEQVYTCSGRRKLLTVPLLRLGGKPGPRFPVEEDPHDLILP